MALAVYPHTLMLKGADVSHSKQFHYRKEFLVTGANYTENKSV